MKKVVSFSGGRTSAYLCYLMKKMHGDDVDFIFMDTGAEHIETYRFLRRVNQYFELNITCLRGRFNTPLGKGNGYEVVDIDDLNPDLKPFTELVGKYGTPSIAGKWCSSRMKEDVHDNYCNGVYGKGNYETWLGIRADEPRRLGVKDGIKYLADISDFGKQDVLNFWEGMPFDLRIDEWLGNCVFCYKKSNLKLAAAAFDEPELMSAWLDMIENAKEREGQGRDSRHVMYRGKKTLEQVIGMFDGSTGDEIKARIRGTKATDTGSCSESCEVFVCEANQIDMF
jgi:hypothetical protein